MCTRFAGSVGLLCGASTALDHHYIFFCGLVYGQAALFNDRFFKNYFLLVTNLSLRVFKFFGATPRLIGIARTLLPSGALIFAFLAFLAGRKL
jgi:hypothetical protein